MSAASTFPPALKFEIGQPQIIALKYAEGKPCPNSHTDTLMFSTTSGDRFFVAPYVGDRIRAAGVQVGVPFELELIETFHGNKRVVEYVVRKIGAGAVQRTPAPQGFNSEDFRKVTVPPNPTPAAPPPLPAGARGQAPGSSTPVNGNGENSAAILSRCYIQAIDIALASTAYAESKGLRITPAFEDIRALAATICISDTQARR
jgi:hypothetical protein